VAALRDRCHAAIEPTYVERRARKARREFLLHAAIVITKSKPQSHRDAETHRGAR